MKDSHHSLERGQSAVKELFKSLLPPLLFEFFSRLSRPKNNVSFASFEDALSACQSNAYEDQELVTVIVEKNRIYREQICNDPRFSESILSALISTMGSTRGTHLNVIDFGGNAGYHYTIVKAAIQSDIPIHWHVVETPAMVRAARKLETDELRFFHDIETAIAQMGPVDIVFSSSALQYTPDPIAYLKKLLEIEANYFYLTRTPFLDGATSSITTIQASKLSENGPGPLPSDYLDSWTRYPITFVNRLEVEALLLQKYDVRFRMNEASGVFRFKRQPITVTGYFLAKKLIPAA